MSRERLREPDDGQISILLVSLTAMCLALIMVFVAATSIHIQHKRLLDLADSLAADAADAIDDGSYYNADGTITHVPVTDGTVRSSVTALLDRQPAIPGCSDVRVVEPTGVTADEVVVSLACTGHPAFAGGARGAVSLTVPLQVSTQARARTSR